MTGWILLGLGFGVGFVAGTLVAVGAFALGVESDRLTPPRGPALRVVDGGRR